MAPVRANIRSSRVRIVWCGQSYNMIPGGLKGVNSIPRLACGPWSGVPYSVTPPAYGSQSWTILLRLADIELPVLGGSAPFTIAVLNGGQSDVNPELNSGAQIAADTAAYAAKLRAAGVDRVVAVTILRARAWTSGMNTARTDFNTQIKTTDAGLYDGIADPASDSRLDASVTPGNDAYFDAIGLHPSILGGTVFAPYVTAVLQPLIEGAQ